jgi:hypothetical protein
MSRSKGPSHARQLSVIESAYSQEIASTMDHHSGEVSTERKDFANLDFSFSPSSSPSGCPGIPSRIASLNRNPLTTSTSQDDKGASKDLEKSETATLSSDGSGPKVAEVVEHSQQDPFAQECEGGVQYRTMAWWYADRRPHLLPPSQPANSPPAPGKQAWS